MVDLTFDVVVRWIIPATMSAGVGGIVFATIVWLWER